MDTRFRILLKIQSEWCIDHWWHVAGAQIWPYLVLWVKFQIADQIVGTLSKFWSGWYIILPICTKENHPQSDCPQVLSVLPLYGIVSTHGYRIQNPLENPVRMMYESLVEVIFCCNVILSCGWSTNIAISGSVGQISNFWSDSWNPLKILIYNTFYSGKKKITCNRIAPRFCPFYPYMA